MNYIALICAVSPAVAQADTLSNAITLDNVISAVGPNWNSAGAFKAVLVREFDDASLYIFNDPFDETPAAVAPAIAFIGGMWGQIPWLEFDESGVLLVFSENMSVGRNRWQETIGIKRQNLGYFVDYYEYNAYDTLDLDFSLDCQINFAAQTAYLNGDLISVDEGIAPVPVGSWNPDYSAVCF